MKIGAVYPQIELRGDPEAVRRIGLAVEALGYDYLLTYDHVIGATHDREPKLTGPYTEQHPFHDPLMRPPIGAPPASATASSSSAASNGRPRAGRASNIT